MINAVIYVIKLSKILGTQFSYKNPIKEESNFLKFVSNVKTVLKVSQFRNPTLERRVVVFKIFAISKIFFQVLIVTVPSHIIKALETIQNCEIILTSK